MVTPSKKTTLLLVCTVLQSHRLRVFGIFNWFQVVDTNFFAVEVGGARYLGCEMACTLCSAALRSHTLLCHREVRQRE